MLLNRTKLPRGVCRVGGRYAARTRVGTALLDLGTYSSKDEAVYARECADSVVCARSVPRPRGITESRARSIYRAVAESVARSVAAVQ